MEDKAKIEKCKYSHPHFKNNSIEYHCVVDGWEDDKVRICKKGECESCQKFKSKYIEYPITVHEIENKPIDLEICRSKFLLHIKKVPDSL